MINEERINQLDGFIAEAKELIEKPYNSPTVDLWKDSVKQFLEEVYGESKVEMFNNLFNIGVVVTGTTQVQGHHQEAMSLSVELLEGLKLKQPPPAPMGSLARTLHQQNKYDRKINQPAKVGATNQHFYNYGTMHAGYGDIVQNISIGELLLNIHDEIQENVPESEEKNAALRTLNAITSNPTFANIVGTSLGVFLNSLLPVRR